MNVYKSKNILLASLIIFNFEVNASELDTITDKMRKMNIDTSLIVQSQAVDDYPLFSKDGKYLAANVAGKWYKINLNKIDLTEASWRNDQKIGVLNSKTSISEASQEEIKMFRDSTSFKPREYTTKNNAKLSLKQKGAGTEFTITDKLGKSEVKWISDLESCHSLSSNSHEKYIAFICEQNGIFLYLVN